LKYGAPVFNLLVNAKERYLEAAVRDRHIEGQLSPFRKCIAFEVYSAISIQKNYISFFYLPICNLQATFIVLRY
jgi:hypothetical protein